MEQFTIIFFYSVCTEEFMVYYVSDLFLIRKTKKVINLRPNKRINSKKKNN